MKHCDNVSQWHNTPGTRLHNPWSINTCTYPLLSEYSSIEQGKGTGCLHVFQGRCLFYILADRRGAYSKGMLIRGEVLIGGFTVCHLAYLPGWQLGEINQMDPWCVIMYMYNAWDVLRYFDSLGHRTILYDSYEKIMVFLTNLFILLLTGLMWITT